MTKIDNETCEIVEPQPPIHLTTHKKDMQINCDEKSEQENSTAKKDLDNIPPMFQFCIYGCVELLEMEFYKRCKLELQLQNDNNDCDNNYNYVTEFDDNILSKVINYREKLIDKTMFEYSPLFTAARFGAVYIVEFLLSTFPYTINIHNLNNLQRSPLFMACFFGRTEVVKLLLNHPTMKVSYVNQQESKGYTSLFVAAQNGHIEIVKLLIDYGGDPDIAQHNSLTPFWIACYRGYDEIVQYFVDLSKKKDIEIAKIKNERLTPLCTIAQENHWKCLELVLEHTKCDINKSNSTQATPLWVAASNGSFESLKVLIQHDANIDQPDQQVRIHSPFGLFFVHAFFVQF